ncbi:hypothetical protein [Kineococcus rubinsiae]|uniref:hypothetical protein n=1 Tax=Kineococcus rubinsiae TaxID=2609562 RepID=UPI00143149E7|nr:hypothetical protein [Kineococcus rubinsiae]NIZ89428.1 hypothetical protein [Kineococcus rubinsiae]
MASSRTPATRRPAPHDRTPHDSRAHLQAARPRGARTTARLLAAGAAVAGLALVAGPAGATPAPTTPDATTAAVTTAVQTSPATAAVPRSAYAVTDVRTAAADPAWAGAALEPTGDDLDPATVVLHLVAGAWTVVDLGTAQVGCGTAPAAVAGDLGLGC